MRFWTYFQGRDKEWRNKERSRDEWDLGLEKQKKIVVTSRKQLEVEKEISFPLSNCSREILSYLLQIIHGFEYIRQSNVKSV